MPQVPIWRGNLQLQEQPNSPQWTFGEKIVAMRTFKGPFATCLTSMPTRGTKGTGAFAGMRVEESSLTKERGEIGLLQVKYAGAGSSQGQPLPPDEVSLQPEKIEKALKKHPRYKTVTESLNVDVRTLLETAQDNPSHFPALERVIASTPEANLAYELYKKLQQGFTHFPYYGPVLKQTEYYWDTPTSISPGGFRQSPIMEGILLPAVDWLREADSLSWNGTHFQLTRAWIGAPDLDTDLFPVI